MLPAEPAARQCDCSVGTVIALLYLQMAHATDRLQVLILRLRQLCCHPRLILVSRIDAPDFSPYAFDFRTL